MDFRQLAQNGTGSRPHANPTPAPSPAPGNKNEDKPSQNGHSIPWWRILNVVMLVGIALLILTIAIVFNRGNGDNEDKLIDTTQYQAVFLSNGQVYFGHVTTLNDKYVQMKDIFYLTQNSATDASGKPTTDSSYTLVKLGCQQIHDPVDQMVINRGQVTFWENLQDNGQVVTKIKEFQKSNPKGPDCSQVSTQTQASSTGTQGNAQATPQSPSATGSGSSTTGAGTQGSSSGTGTGTSANGGASTNKQ